MRTPSARHWLALLLLALLGSTWLSSHALAARGRPHLNAAGTTLVADNGGLLRGAQTATDFGSLTSLANVLATTNCGCNALHLYAERSDQGYAAGAQVNRVDTLVQWTRTNGLYLIITIGGGGGATESFTTNFWNFYAGRYANETHVLYEIHNEPTSGGAPLSPSVIAMETNCYQLIHAQAPQTPILLFSYLTFNSGSGVLQDVNALGPGVDWSKAAIAFHGYGNGGRNGCRATLLAVLQAGYPCFQTEFYRWPWGTGNFKLGEGASMYQDVSETGDFERLGVSWLSFISASLMSQDARFKNPLLQAGILWTPDFGSWPAGARAVHGNGGEPWSTTNLTGTLHIEAEDFDEGGQGIAYSDTTPGNSGGAYRTSEAVDIESTQDTGGGYDVGWLAPGEWLEYTTYINNAGLYDLQLRVASALATNSLSVRFGSSNVTGPWTFTGTGANQVWKTITHTVFLTPGQQILHLDGLSSGFKLNWMELTPVSSGLLANGTYRLVNRSTGKVLEVAGAATTNGARLEQMSYSGNSNQIWVVTHQGGNNFKLASLQTGKVIDEASYTALTGDYIQTWSSANSGNQRWILTPTDAGYFTIASANSGLVLEVVANAMTNGARIDQREYNGDAQQQWTFQMPQAARPRLSIVPKGPTVVISYPASENGSDYSGYQLQESDFRPMTGWLTVGAAQLSGSAYSATIATTNAGSFFRLSKP